MKNHLSLLLSKSHVRWFIVGCLTVVIDTTLFLTLFQLTNKPIVSNLISGTIATTFNYVAHYHWSFSSDRKHTQSTVLYLTFFFIFLLLGTTSIKFLISSGVPPLFSKLGTAGAIAPVSFFLMKFVTFKRGISE